jgi:hypothetical protein
MLKYLILSLAAAVLTTTQLRAQATLPNFTLKNTDGKISVLWLNSYSKPVKGISVQRSYDSTKNFFSIASVLNPQNTVNGFTDSTAPYGKMYYRLFIGFDTGVYILTPSKRPEMNSTVDYSKLIVEINALYEKNAKLQEENLKLQKEIAQLRAEKLRRNNALKNKNAAAAKKPTITEVDQDVLDNVITFPSKRIFTDKDNNVVIRLYNTRNNRYQIRFLTEDYKKLFEINNPVDDFMIVEKVNFHQGGWYQFEIYKNDYLLEENKFFISKEEKK